MTLYNVLYSTVLAVNLDFNSKLHGLINELRGELGAAQRGNKDAKDRLLKSECNDAKGCYSMSKQGSYRSLKSWKILEFCSHWYFPELELKNEEFEAHTYGFHSN